MATLGEMLIKIGGDTGNFDKSIKSVNSNISTFGANLKQGLSIGAGMQIFQSLFDTIVGGFKDAIGMGWQFNSTMEQNLASFTTMLGGSQVEAEKMVNSLTKMANTTPFETADLTKGATTLMGFGVEATKVEGILRMLGDASQGNRDRFNSLTLAFAQVSASGKLTGGDLLQMVNAGFNPLQVMAKSTGESLSSLKDKMSEGAISADMVTNAFKMATSQGGLFYQSMEKQSKTFEGQMSTLRDTISLTFGAILKPLFDWISTVGLPNTIKLLETFKNMITDTKEAKFITEIKKSLEFLQPAINLVKNYFNELKYFIEPWSKTIQAQISKFGNDLKPTWEYIKKIIDSLKPVFNNLWAIVKFVLNNMIKDLKFLYDVAFRVWNGLIQALQPFLKAFTNIFAIIINIIGVVINLIKLDFASAWKNLQQIILNVILAIKNILSTLFNFLDGFFKGALTKFVNFGKEIVNGIWKGMLEGKTWLINKVKELSNDVANTIKKFFGIASPAKLTTQYGGYIAEGLGVGINNKSNLAIDSAKEMADKVKEQFENLKQSTIEKTNKMGDIIINALKKQYDAQEKAQTTSLNNQIKELQKATDLKIKQYDRELSAQLKLLDAGTSDRIKSLQNQIDALNQTTSDEEKALKQQEYQTKVANLQKKISETKLANEKISLQNDLNELIAQKQREHQLEVRSDLIKSLQNEIENIKNQNELKKEQLKIEFDTKKENEKNLLDLKVSSLNEELNSVKKHYDELRNEESLQADARKLMLDKNNQDLVNLLNTYAPNWQEAGKSFGEKLLEGINSQKQNIINAVKEMMALVDRANSLSQNVQNIIPQSIQTPFKPFTFGGKIPALANGGIVNQPTLALIGESGSEAVIPLSQMGNYGSGTTVYVQLDGRTIAKASAPAMVRELKMQGVYV